MRNVFAIRWQKVIEALGLTPDRHLLPASTTCPLCQKGTLHVYNDPGHTDWYSCGRCGFGGDGLDLSALVWKKSHADSLRQFRAWGFTEITDSLIHEYEKTADRVDPCLRLWQISEPDFQAAATLLPGGKPPTMTPPNWKVMARLATRRQIIDTFTTHTDRFASIPKTWAQFAVLPLESYPGRLAGILAALDHDNRIVPARKSDTTLSFALNAAHSIASEFLVIRDDIPDVLRMQLANLRGISRMLPLCGTLNQGGISPAWPQIRCRKVFWTTTVTPGFFREAISCSGECVVRKSLPAEQALAAQLRLLVTQAKPWPLVLANYLSTLDQTDARNFVLSIGMGATELRLLLDATVPAVYEALVPLLETATDVIRYHNTNIFKQNNEIFGREANENRNETVSANSFKICDALILIHEVRSTGELTYKGEVRWRTKSFKFEIPARKLEENGEGWLREQFWIRGWGVPYIRNGWRSDLGQLGMMLGQPAWITAPPGVGWSHEFNGLVAGTWRVERGGKLTEWQLTGNGAPGDILMPTGVSATAIRALSEATGTCAFWSVLANVVANLLTPITNKQPRDLLLLGEGAQYVGSLAARIAGCSVMSTKLATATTNMLTQLEASAKANWPVLLLVNSVRDPEPGMLLAERIPTIFRPYRDPQGLQLAINHDCDIVDLQQTSGTAAAIENFGDVVLPAYLQDLAKRDFKLNLTEDVTASVLADLRLWWKSLGGDTDVHTRLFSGAACARHVLQRLLVLCRPKMFGVPPGFSGVINTRHIPIETDPDFMYLRPALLQEKMASRIQIDTSRLGQQLHRAGLLQSDPTGPVWALPIGIWNNVIRPPAATTPMQKKF